MGCPIETNGGNATIGNSQCAVAGDSARLLGAAKSHTSTVGLQPCHVGPAGVARAGPCRACRRTALATRAVWHIPVLLVMYVLCTLYVKMCVTVCFAESFLTDVLHSNAGKRRKLPKAGSRYHVGGEVLGHEDLQTLADYRWLNDKVDL